MDSGVFHFYFELWSNMTILLWPNLFCSLPLIVLSVGNRRSLYWVKSWVHMYCEPELCHVENSLAKPFLHLGQSQEGWQDSAGAQIWVFWMIIYVCKSKQLHLPPFGCSESEIVHTQRELLRRPTNPSLCALFNNNSEIPSCGGSTPHLISAFLHVCLYVCPSFIPLLPIARVPEPCGSWHSCVLLTYLFPPFFSLHYFRTPWDALSWFSIDSALVIELISPLRRLEWRMVFTK